MIFVVDDSSAGLMVAAAALESEYRVLTMASAEKLFSMLNRLRPDMILLDIEMPGMGGFETIAELKKDPDRREIPVVFLTGWSDGETAARAMEAGALGIIGKPFEPAALRDLVKKYLEN